MAERVAPLTFGQQRLWFLHQVAAKPAALNLAFRYDLAGPLAADLLARALDEIVRRHESLRTRFVAEDGLPYQIIDPARPFAVPIIDLSALPDRESEATRIAEDIAQQPFDLVTGPLLRCQIVRLAAERHVLLLVMHHIISDGWSLGVLWRELSSLYTAYRQEQPPSLTPLPQQFADFAIWQRDWLQGKAVERRLDYWKHQLAGVKPSVLATDRPRPAAPSFEGELEYIHLPAALTAGLRELSRQEGVTLFMTLLAGWQVLLFRYSGQPDIAVGAPVAGRHRGNVEALIGFFVNTIVLRIDLSAARTFRELLQQVRPVVMGALLNQDVPFEQIIEQLQPERSSTRNPLFQLIFSLQNATLHSNTRDLPDVTVTVAEIRTKASKFDLNVTLVEEPDAISGTLEYDTDLFDAETMQQMLEHYQALLASMIADPDQRIDAVPLLSDAEQEQLRTWNATAASYPDDQTLDRLFAAQVARTPDAVALIETGAPTTRTLHYAELDQRANQLAHQLRTLGVEPEQIVGVCLDRSLELVVALLAVLKAGGAYLPLDPSYPAQRLHAMLEDAQPRVLLTTAALQPQIIAAPGDLRVICLDTDAPQIATWPTTAPPATSTADNLAYVIFTSGSTGRPKGVLATHQATLNRFAWMWAAYPFQPNERASQKTALSFVDSIWELFGPLLQGVPVVIIPDHVVQNPAALIATLAEQQVTRLVLVPTLLRVLLEVEPRLNERLPQLRLWSVSGEALAPDLVHSFRAQLPDRTLLNLYGSSEVAADATAYVVEASLDGNVPIGRPLPNVTAHVLDAQQQPVPIGVIGELYIGGVQLVRGYIGQAALTAERFVPDPFRKDEGGPSGPRMRAEAGGRLYRTGDLARYRRDGTLEYLGRIDQQIKVRGFRIELGEIEAVLRRHPAVREAAVVISEETAGQAQLIGYIVAAPDVWPTLDELRQFLRAWLPDYMVPAALVQLPALPLTPSGKLDRQALPTPDEQAYQRAAHVAARTEHERLLVQAWEQELGVSPIGVYDNYFLLGGDSIGLILLSQRMRTYGLSVSPADVLHHQTIADLAAALAARS